MIVIKELIYVSLDKFSLLLGNMNMEQLNIFSIYDKLDLKPIDILKDNSCRVRYMQLQLNTFIELINSENYNFLDYNKNSLYIIRGGNYIDIKNMFSSINNFRYNLGRGGSQKAHVLSPLDFRLSSYMMAMSRFNYNLISNLNMFNRLGKERYLSWTNNHSSSNIIKPK